MYKIAAPNKNYNGISAGVHFTNGEAITDKSIEWFRKKGYTVKEIKADKKEKEKDKDDNPDKKSDGEIK